jgi:hypothetical protein
MSFVTDEDVMPMTASEVGELNSFLGSLAKKKKNVRLVRIVEVRTGVRK